MSGRLDGLGAVRTGWMRVPKGRKRPTEGRREGCVRPVAGDALLRGLSPSRTVGDASEKKPARRSGAAVWRRQAELSGRPSFGASCLDAGYRGARPATMTVWEDGEGWLPVSSAQRLGPAGVRLALRIGAMEPEIRIAGSGELKLWEGACFLEAFGPCALLWLSVATSGHARPRARANVLQ